MRIWIMRSFVLTLALGGLSLAAGLGAPKVVHAQEFGAAVHQVSAAVQPAQPIVSGSTGGTTDMPPAGCAAYDSWCSYCTNHSAPAVCQAYQPGHSTRGGTSSSTPGVGSPSVAPSR
jgi:hypothetical protein